uniref:Uncharacterized protein n=1 Tax=Aegilops tauschii subsp. strangulata TaxID=200361 RepID=A0A453H3L7_AEGTS
KPWHRDDHHCSLPPFRCIKRASRQSTPLSLILLVPEARKPTPTRTRPGRKGRGGRAEAQEHGLRQGHGRRRRQQRRRRQPAPAAARPQVPRLEGHALHHRERDVREAGDAGHVGEPAGVPDAGVPHAERGRRDAAQRAQRHHQ